MGQAYTLQFRFRVRVRLIQLRFRVRVTDRLTQLGFKVELGLWSDLRFLSVLDLMVYGQL